jgi:hypothetical protein
VLVKLISPETASIVVVPTFVKVTPIPVAVWNGVLFKKTSPPRLKAVPLVKARLILERFVPTVLPKVMPPVPATKVRVRLPLLLVRAPVIKMFAPGEVVIATSAPRATGPVIVIWPPEVV